MVRKNNKMEEKRHNGRQAMAGTLEPHSPWPDDMFGEEPNHISTTVSSVGDMEPEPLPIDGQVS